ncbi:MAG: polysaccharide biosynthesis protein [Acidimicrobiales bacterium]
MRSKPNRERSRHASPRGRKTPGPTRHHHLLSRRIVVDGLAWFIATFAGTVTAGLASRSSLLIAIIATGIHLTVGASSGLYRGRWRMASFDEAAALAAVTGLTAIGLAASLFVFDVGGRVFGFSALVPFASLGVMLLARGVHRSSSERRIRPDSDELKPVVVFGAGDGAVQLVRAMFGNAASRYRPVAMLDDDPAKQNLRIQGVPVRGGRRDLARVARLTGCELVVIAIPSAGAAVIRSVVEDAERCGLDVRILPPTQEIVDGIVSLADIREITESDLLGRRMIDTDVHAIAGYLSEKRVLVTGAGGSIGSELCRQISRFDPSRLIMLDRDESALHGVQLSIEGRALLQSRNLVVADIRDRDRLNEVFAEHEPDVVFHAAALKHLPLLELYPEEAWKTNVEGTNNVLRASAKVGVTHFVNISTDKAASPTSVLGYSKRLAEQLTAWYANRTRGDWVSVRFGNVLGSRGSMLQTFRTQIAAGGPITVTDPEVTRYFMTPEEACQLVIQAGAVGHRGEALVLDMGEPIRILDVAERLAANAPVPIEIIFTGLRPGEKMHERLVGTEELDIRRAHPLISHVSVPSLTPTQLGLFDRSSETRARDSMAELCDGTASSPFGFVA